MCVMIMGIQFVWGEGLQHHCTCKSLVKQKVIRASSTLQCRYSAVKYKPTKTVKAQLWQLRETSETLLKNGRLSC